MDEQDDGPERGAQGEGVRDAVMEEVGEARRGIFSAYISARRRGIVMAADEDVDGLLDEDR
jgi:hypothetical protein